MSGLFGTDGIRGIAYQDPVTADTAVRLGYAAVNCLRREGRPEVIVLGRDTRASGLMLESALISGITTAGGEALTAGVVPTPAVAHLTREFGGLGIVISASHNPCEYNGFKLFSGEGFKLSKERESEIEDLIRAASVPSEAPLNAGEVTPLDHPHERYLSFLTRTLPPGFSLKGMKIVLDCAQGAAFRTAPVLMERLGAEVEVLSASPDGENINRDCGSEHTEALENKVLETGADAGLALDGDGDRLVAVDEKGKALTGDQVLVICARTLQNQGELDNPVLVSTAMSNMGLEVALKEMGIRHVTTDVGDRCVMEEMLRLDAQIGGEESGHIIFREHHTTGDGLLSALRLLHSVQVSGKTLSALGTWMEIYPQCLINVKVRHKPHLADVREVAEALKAAEKGLGDKGRVLLRYSGTEPLCRVMVEGEKKERIEAFARSIAEAVERELG